MQAKINGAAVGDLRPDLTSSQNDANGHEFEFQFQHTSRDLICDSVDDLVTRGIENVLSTGREVRTRAGAALQSYNVNYVLTNSRDRLHLLRKPAVQYL